MFRDSAREVGVGGRGDGRSEYHEVRYKTHTLDPIEEAQSAGLGFATAVPSNWE